MDISESLFGETALQNLWWKQPFEEWFCDYSCGSDEMTLLFTLAAWPCLLMKHELGKVIVSGHFGALRCLVLVLCWHYYVWARVSAKVAGAMNVDTAQKTEMTRFFGQNSSAASGSWRRNFLRGAGGNACAVDPCCTCGYAMDQNGLGQQLSHRLKENKLKWKKCSLPSSD